MLFNYDKLKGRIREVCKTQYNFAQKLGISSTSLSSKLNNNTEFTQSEMNLASIVLGINKQDIPEYFFTPQVQKTKQNESA